MKFYEIVTHWVGESYVRAYAWAHDESEALEIAKPHFVALAGRSPRPDDLQAVLCFDQDALPFCTIFNDCGWPESLVEEKTIK